MPQINTADSLRLGSQVVDRVYKGTTRVFPKSLPADLSGLVVHLDASKMPLGALGTWTDLSGTGHHGTVIGSPAPVVVAGPKGRRVVRFTAGQGGVREVADTGVTKDYTALYVARIWGATKARVVSAYYPPQNFLFGFWSTYEDALYAAPWADPDPKKTVTDGWKLYSSDGSSDAYSREVLADAPLLYYKLDETSGTTVTDSSGNGHHGTYVGAPTLNQPSALGKSISTDGVDDQITIPTSLSIPSGSSITLEWWQYMTTANVAQNVTFRLGADENTTQRILTHAPWVDKNVYWDYGDIASGGRVTGVYTPHLDKLTLVQMLYDAAFGYRAIYFDTVLAGAANAAGYPTVVRAGGVFSGVGHKAAVDEIAVYNTPLPPARRLAHYNARTNYHPRLFRDGSFIASSPAATSHFGGTYHLSPAQGSGNNESSDCEIAELVIYNRKLIDADRQKVESYLRKKWL